MPLSPPDPYVSLLDSISYLDLPMDSDDPIPLELFPPPPAGGITPPPRPPIAARPLRAIVPSNLPDPFPRTKYTELDSTLPSEVTVSMDEYDVACARSLLGPSVEMVVPPPGSTILEPPSPHFFGVHLMSLRRGLRFPLHPFVVSVLDYYGIAPGQLVPNSHRLLVAFLIRCANTGATPSLNLFNYYLNIGCSSAALGKGFAAFSARPNRKIFHEPKTSNHTWKPQFVFVSTGPSLPFRVSWAGYFCKHKAPAAGSARFGARAHSIAVLDGNYIDAAALVTEAALTDLGFERHPPPPPRAAVEVFSGSEDDPDDDAADSDDPASVGLGAANPEAVDLDAPGSDSSDMAGRLLSCEELVNRVRSRPAPKRQRTGESSRACPPPSSVPPVRQTRSRETSLPTSASASVDPPTLAVEPPPRAPSSSVSDVRVGWPAEIPPTASLLEGDVPLEAVARRLISPRDSKVLEEGSGLRFAFELLFRQTLLEGNLRAAQVLLEEERRRTAGLSEVLVLRDRELQEVCAREKAQAEEIKRHAEEAQRHAEEAKKYADALKACQEALILEIPRYRESEVYRRDVESYITAHGEDVISGWLATEAGQERLASEGVLMYDVGQYTMQRDLYAALRRRDASFDPTAWGLPPALDNPDPAATAESVQPADAAAEPRSSSAPQSVAASPTQFADDLPDLSLGLGTAAAALPLDQIHIPEGMDDLAPSTEAGATSDLPRD